MNRGVILLSMMLDCWKNSCHGATVVPTMAMISRTASLLIPPWMPGTTRCFAADPQLGWDSSSIGIWTRLTAMNANMARSHRAKDPEAVIAISATAASGTTR